MTDPDTPPPGPAAAEPDTPADAPKVPLAAAFRRTSPHSSQALVPMLPFPTRDLALSSATWSKVSRDLLQHAGIVNQLARDRARLFASFASISRLAVIEPPPFQQPTADLQLGLARMVASRDLGLLGLQRQLATSAWNVVSGSAGPLLPFKLTDLLGQWRELALFGTGLLRRLAWDAYAAALDARDAVIHGDKAHVAVFVKRWLRLKPTPDMVEAVSMALLDPGWDEAVPDDPTPLISDLRKRTERAKRNLAPIWKTQINHQKIGLLGAPLRTRRGASGAVSAWDAPETLQDVLADPSTPEDLVISRVGLDDRLGPILNMLKPDELGVVRAYAGCDGLTWAQAATMAGEAEPAGERVRRKLKRLRDEQERRRLSQLARM